MIFHVNALEETSGYLIKQNKLPIFVNNQNLIFCYQYNCESNNLLDNQLANSQNQKVVNTKTVS